MHCRSELLGGQPSRHPGAGKGPGERVTLPPPAPLVRISEPACSRHVTELTPAPFSTAGRHSKSAGHRGASGFSRRILSQPSRRGTTGVSGDTDVSTKVGSDGCGPGSPSSGGGRVRLVVVALGCWPWLVVGAVSSAWVGLGSPWLPIAGATPQTRGRHPVAVKPLFFWRLRRGRRRLRLPSDGLDPPKTGGPNPSPTAGGATLGPGGPRRRTGLAHPWGLAFCSAWRGQGQGQADRPSRRACLVGRSGLGRLRWPR